MNDPRPEPVDLRAPVLACIAWLTALAALHAPSWVLAVGLAAASLHALHRRLRGHEVLSRVAWIVAGCGVAGSALLRAEAVEVSPVEALARQSASVERARGGDVRSDPAARPIRAVRRVPCSHGLRGRSGTAPPGARAGPGHRGRALGRRGARVDAGRPGSAAACPHPRPRRRAEPPRPSGRAREAGPPPAGRGRPAGLGSRRGGPAPGGSTCPGARPRRRGRHPDARSADRGLPHGRSHPPARGVGHEPDARGRLLVAPGPLGGRAGPRPGRSGRARRARFRAARAPRAQRPAGGGDGLGRPARHGAPRASPWAPGVGGRGAPAAARRPLAGAVARVRALGAGHRGHPLVRTGLA